MNTTAHTGLRFKHFIPGIIWFFLILFMICLPQSNVPDIEIWWIELIKPDKLIHTTMFGIQSWLFILPFKKAKTQPKLLIRRILGLTVFVVLWGLTTEVLQLNVPGRSFEWMDWVADSFGATLVAIYFIRKEKKILNQA